MRVGAEQDPDQHRRDDFSNPVISHARIASIWLISI
jgi:hypothetical protein